MESNEYFKSLGEEFLAQSHPRPSRMNHTHVHAVYELYFCPAPVDHHCVICGREFDYCRPTAILVKPYTIHAMSANQPLPEGERWYVFSFSERIAKNAGMLSVLEELFSDKLGLLFDLTDAQAAYLKDILRFLFDEDQPLREQDALALFSFFLRRLQSLISPEQITGVGATSYSVQLVMRHICENFHMSLTAESLARQFSVSRSKLDRDFKRDVGVTPKDFIEQCRLHCAKKLLATNRDWSIVQVAQLSGFPSENYFYRFFRNRMGMTPGQYKKALTKSSHI